MKYVPGTHRKSRSTYNQNGSDFLLDNVAKNQTSVFIIGSGTMKLPCHRATVVITNKNKPRKTEMKQNCSYTAYFQQVLWLDTTFEQLTTSISAPVSRKVNFISRRVAIYLCYRLRKRCVLSFRASCPNER